MRAMWKEPRNRFFYWGRWWYLKEALETGVSHRSGPVGEPGGRFLYWGLERRTTGGSGNGASVSIGALWWEIEVDILYWKKLRVEPGGRAPVLWTLNNMNRKALETGICLQMVPFGDPIWGLFYRGLWEIDVGVLSERSVSLSLFLSLGARELEAMATLLGTLKNM